MRWVRFVLSSCAVEMELRNSQYLFCDLGTSPGHGQPAHRRKDLKAFFNVLDETRGRCGGLYIGENNIEEHHGGVEDICAIVPPVA